mgnify:CR=1 FL=1
MDNNFIICYTNTASNIACYDLTDNIDMWKQNNATQPYQINYIFREKWDISDKTKTQEIAFLNNCRKYGFQKTDLHAKFTTPKNHTIELLGLNLKNRKYKFIIFDFTDNKEYKVTEHYMKNATKIP